MLPLPVLARLGELGEAPAARLAPLSDGQILPSAGSDGFFYALLGKAGGQAWL
jgi:hypothetical protein